MNRATRTVVTAIGVVLGIAGIDHGIFEVLQGNTPTNGVLITAIGEDQRMWRYGGEEAITLIPNFLYSGTAAIAVSFALMVWSLRYMDRRRGPIVFLLLCVLLLLVGGGIGFILLALPTWAFATRINSPLIWWRKALPQSIRPLLAKLWPITSALAVFLFLIGLLIAIVGYVPRVSDPETILNIDWAILLAALLLFVFSFVCGFAADIEAQGRVEIE